MSQSNPHFATTQWTLVWQAAKEDSKAGRPALAELVRRYWQPLYTFARRRGLSSEDAEDATQEFLSAVVEGDLLGNADPAKGKFRSYLLVAWKRFLVDQFRKGNAQKRGGEAVVMSIDVGNGEKQWLQLEAREPDADRVFLKSWAQSLLDEARHRLRQEYYSRNKSRLVESLLPKLTSNVAAEERKELASQLGLSQGAVKVAIHRMRQKFGEALRSVVSETVDEPEEVDKELDELLEVLKSSTKPAL